MPAGALRTGQAGRRSANGKQVAELKLQDRVRVAVECIRCTELKQDQHYEGISGCGVYMCTELKQDQYTECRRSHVLSFPSFLASAALPLLTNKKRQNQMTTAMTAEVAVDLRIPCVQIARYEASISVFPAGPKMLTILRL